jgi:A/G-specific adenine glycosylase
MKMDNNSLQSVFNALIPWYLEFFRKLPWRSNPLPYQVWLSEIVFQQTRIEQGLPYYHRILKTYPDVFLLAKAKEDDLLRLWQGLGYYSRALNLHKAAKIIIEKYKGIFPNELADIQSLPGIGPYTGAAIASIAYEMPVAVFDGNVRRIIGRIFCISNPVSKDVCKALEGIMKNYQPSFFNQSMMELGALICKPKSPDCDCCPVKEFCCAYKKNTISEFPSPKIKKEKAKLQLLYFKILRADMPGKFALVKRNRSSIWKGLYEFPSIEGHAKDEIVIEFSRKYPFLEVIETPEFLMQGKHELTHKSITADFYSIYCSGNFPSHLEWHDENSVKEKGMHKLMFEFFN